MKYHIFLLLLLTLLHSSCKINYEENEVCGKYVPINYKLTKDTIDLHPNGIYYRKVYDVNGKLMLDIEGKWKIHPPNNIDFNGFYLNLDDDLVKFPELVKDQDMGMGCVLEINNNNKIQFCVGYYEGKNCYEKL